MRILEKSVDGYSFYRRVLRTLNRREVQFLVGGAQTLENFTGITRKVKDLDIYVRPRDVPSALDSLSSAGYQTEMSFPHWLAKARERKLFVDIIFRSGNGLCEVNDIWFEHAVEGNVFGMPVRCCSVEEMIWSKAFVMERERYDGADVAHLLRSCADQIDWQRLLFHFGPYWRVLLSHLILFGFIYPGERSLLPDWVLRQLLDRLQNETDITGPLLKVCQGTLLSRIQYIKDVDKWGYQDARLRPFGPMQPEEAAQWTGEAAKASSSLA